MIISKDLSFFSFLSAMKISSTFSQLDEIEDAMSNLESTIMKLDAYSRSLESQVKKYEKTFLATRTVSPSKE
jgi:exonuclease VII small subunit